MKIDELITELEKVKEEHGNLEVVYDMGLPIELKVTSREIFTDSKKRLNLSG